MGRFANAREAKEFLVSKIVEEAQREGAPLSEIERKMLYFTETGWTLPDMMEVSDEFDRTYDQDEYEEKIAELVKHSITGAKKENPQEYKDWWDAIGVLKKEDNYILVPVMRARLRPPGDQLRLFGTALVLVVVLMAVIIGLASIPESWTQVLERHIPSKNALDFYICAGLAAVIASYLAMLLIYGKQKANEAINDAFGAILSVIFRDKKQ